MRPSVGFWAASPCGTQSGLATAGLPYQPRISPFSTDRDTPSTATTDAGLRRSPCTAQEETQRSHDPVPEKPYLHHSNKPPERQRAPRPQPCQLRQYQDIHAHLSFMPSPKNTGAGLKNTQEKSSLFLLPPRPVPIDALLPKTTLLLLLIFAAG